MRGVGRKKMRTRMPETARWLALLLLTCVAAVGCTSYRSHREAIAAEQLEDWDQAVLHYLELVRQSPDDINYRAGLLRAKIRASQHHFEVGRQFYEAGVLDRAAIELRQAVELDPTNQYAQVELDRVLDELDARAAARPVTPTLEELKTRTAGQRPQPPTLNPRSADPISLDFPEPISVMDIYDALGKAFGINILFDPNLRDQQISITLDDVVAKDALEILMRTAGHFYKVLDEHSILIAADTPQNRRNYEDLVIQTFFLSNAEVKEVITMLRALVGSKNIAANDQLNAIVLRDTADRVKVAERIIQTNDKARGEVVVDVELLEFNTGALRELGLALSDYFVVQAPDPNPARLSDLEFYNQSNWLMTLPSFIYNFVKTSTEAQILAKPQLRISDGESASLIIGDRVPIPVTTFNTANTIGGNIVPVTSFQYQDVGIQIEIEPRIHHNREITLDLTVEVSQITGTVEGSQGTSQPIIGTRTIESTIRLKDGETNFLAGLIQTAETNTDTGIPGLSEIPVLGRLFKNKKREAQRTDLVLTMTPHLIRSSTILEEDLLPIWVGTESNITFRGGSPRVESDVSGPFDDEIEADDDTERIQELLRRRMQNLPRRPQDDDDGDDEVPQGIDLLNPDSGETDIFGRPIDEDEDEDDEPPIQRMSSRQGPAPRYVLAADDGSQPPPAGGAPVKLWFGPREVATPPGSSFEVELRVSTTAEISHLPMTVLFNPDILGVETVTQGDFLGIPGVASLMWDVSEPGRLVLGVSRLGERPGVVGTGVVARVRFHAKQEGTDALSFVETSAMDPRLEKVGPINKQMLRIRVDPGALPMEPLEGPSRPRKPKVG